MKGLTSKIMLVVLLTSTLALAYNIQSAKAIGPIYIRSDGSIDPPTTSIQRKGRLYTLKNDITCGGLIIERDDIVIDGGGFAISPETEGGAALGILVSGRRNVTIKQINTAGNFYRGVTIASSSKITISNSRIVGSTSGGGVNDGEGLYVDQYSTGNTILENTLWGGAYAMYYNGSQSVISKNKASSSQGGMGVGGSGNNVTENIISYNDIYEGVCVLGISGSFHNISGNIVLPGGGGGDKLVEIGGSFHNISRNDFSSGCYLSADHSNITENHFHGDRYNGGIRLSGNGGNTMYHNYFSSESVGDSLPNVLDNGYPSGGNYWSDYSGVDLYKGPYQNVPGSDGIGDTPYLLGPGNLDNYPLMNPYYINEIAVTAVQSSGSVFPRGSSVPVMVTVDNHGMAAATFNLTANATYEYSPSLVTARLQHSAVGGWNDSIPGPVITVNLGDSVSLTIEATDTLHHKFYVDYNGNAFPDADEPQTASFMSTTVTLSFVADRAGVFKYRCAYNAETAFGQFVVNDMPHGTWQIGSQYVTLASKQTKTVTIVWDTASFVEGDYRLSAQAIPLPLEIDVSDNTYIDGLVRIEPPIFFEDGFDSGSFSAWSGTYVSSGETASVVSSLKHHGLYCARFTSNGGGGIEKAYAYKTWSSSELYARGYFYVSQSGIVENLDRFYFIIFRVGSASVAYAGWEKTGGIVHWNLLIRDGTNLVIVQSTNVPVLNMWYCVELHWKKDAASGLGELWVDGVKVCSVTGKNTAAYGNVGQVRFGLPEINQCASTTAYGDCAKISSTYIGPESSPLIFQDGFESGSFSAWSSKRKSLGETATVVSTLKHHGMYSAKFTSNGGGGYERAYCNKTILSSSELYARGYFYVSKSGIADKSDRFYFIILRAGSKDVAYAGWKKTGGTVKWCLTIRDGTTNVDIFSSASPLLNRWYCVELHWKKDAANGLAEIWVDGVLVCSGTGRNTASYGDVNSVRCGLADMYGCASTTIYCDCVKIATAYVGPET